MGGKLGDSNSLLSKSLNEVVAESGISWAVSTVASERNFCFSIHFLMCHGNVVN